MQLIDDGLLINVLEYGVLFFSFSESQSGVTLNLINILFKVINTM